MHKKTAVIASSIDPIKQGHLLDWFKDFLKVNSNVQLFLGSRHQEIPYAKNYKINSKFEKLKYLIKGKSPHKYQPLIDYRPEIIHLLTSNQFNNLNSVLFDDNQKLIVSFRGYDINVFPFLDEENFKTTQLIFQRSNVLHFISMALRDTALSIGADESKCKVIYRSINTSNYIVPDKTPYSKESTIKILSVGRLVWEKGYIYALETLAILKINNFNFNYTIVGDGVDYNLLKYHVKRLNLEDCVCFLLNQSREEIPKILSESDIYFQPSISEALSNSIIEASFYKLPIVSSNIGGIPEVVEHNVSGYLSEICKPEGYAESLIKLIEDRELRFKMGEKGHQIVYDRFSREKEILEWERLFESL